MNNLLKGLLSPDLAIRLSAEEALEMPIFDDFLGSSLPLHKQQTKAYYLEGHMDTFFEDEYLRLSMIQSLESKSKMLMNAEDLSSQFSVRFEGQAHSSKQSNKKTQKKPRSQKSHFVQSSNFQDGTTFSEIRSGSQASWKDEISPLNSPQGQLRMLPKQELGKNPENILPGFPLLIAAPITAKSQPQAISRSSLITPN